MKKKPLKDTKKRVEQYHGGVNGKKKAPLWLWAMGWICIFPIPLGALVFRKLEMKRATKLIIIVLSWMLYAFWGWFIYTREHKEKGELQSATGVTTSQNMLKETETTMTTEENKKKFYEKDEVINQFISDFNQSQDVEISDISEGNIKQKAYAHIGTVQIEMLNSYEAAARRYNMSIFGGRTNEDTEAMLGAFRKVAIVLDPNLTSEQIEEVISAWREKTMLASDITLGELTVNCYWHTDISNSRIDLSSLTYAHPK